MQGSSSVGAALETFFKEKARKREMEKALDNEAKQKEEICDKGHDSETPKTSTIELIEGTDTRTKEENQPVKPEECESKNNNEEIKEDNESESTDNNNNKDNDENECQWLEGDIDGRVRTVTSTSEKLFAIMGQGASTMLTNMQQDNTDTLQCSEIEQVGFRTLLQ